MTPGNIPAGSSGIRPRSRRALAWWLAAVTAMAIVAGAWLALRPEPEVPGEFPRDPELRRAHQLIFGLDATVADYEAAEKIVRARLAAQPDDVEAVIVAAEVNNWFFFRGFDRGEIRYWEMQRFCRLALELAPDRPEALAAMGEFLLAREADLPRAAELLRRAIGLNPRVPRWHSSLAEVLRIRDPAAGRTVLENAVAHFPGDVLLRYNIARHYRDAGDLAGFEHALDEAIAVAPLANALLWKARVQLWAYGDLPGMRATLDRVPAPLRVSERAAVNLFVHACLSRQTDEALAVLRKLPTEWFEDYDYTGPKGLLTGNLLEIADNAAEARLHYQGAFAEVARRKPLSTSDPTLRVGELWSLIGLRRHAEARAAYRVYLNAMPRPYRLGFFTSWWFSEIPACVVLDDRPMALTLIREAAETAEGRAQLRIAFRVDPRMAAWRDDSEVTALLDEPAVAGN